MKKIFLFFTFIFAFYVFSLAAEENPTLRVGLYYAEDAMPSANLQVTNGMGYRFGFFDSNKSFIKLYSVSDVKITMAKDSNMWFADGKFYDTGAPSGAKLLGAYHVEVLEHFSNLSAAENKCLILNQQGYSCFIAYANGAYRVRVGAFSNVTDAEALRAKIGGMVVGASDTAVSVYNTVSGKILFEFDGGTYTSLAVNPTQGEVEMPLTWFKGMKFNGAFEYVRNSGDITVVNVVPMQDYLKGVLPWEMYPSDPLEALKAQALCARTYAYYNMGKHGSEFDICAGTHCQAYRGMERANDTTNRAVDETIGQYILYSGRPINAVFHSCNGGATEDAKNVWGSDIAYLKGKIDPYEKTAEASNGIWSFEFTPQEITDILNAKGYKAALIKDAYVAEYTPLGNVLRVVYVDVNGKEWEFKRERARTIINSSSLNKYTRSQRYKITRSNGGGGENFNILVNSSAPLNIGNDIWAIGRHGVNIITETSPSIITANGIITPSANSASTGGSGNIIISGTGWGHNVGMSQEGAADMARLGMTAYDIIHFYYTDVTITNEN